MGAHSTSDDPTRYREQAEVDAWATKDPLDRLRKHLALLGLVSDASDAALEPSITAEISEAIAEVEAPAARRAGVALRRRLRRGAWSPREQGQELKKAASAPTRE